MTMSGRSDRNTSRALSEPNPATPRTSTHLRKENNSFPWTPLCLMNYLLLSSVEVISRVLTDDHFSNSLLPTSVSIQAHQTLHRNEGCYLLSPAPPARDGFPEMLHLISPGRRLRVKVSSQFHQSRKPMHSYSQAVLEGWISSTELLWFSLWWHSGFAVLQKEAKALSKSHLCLRCFYNLSSWGPQKTPQENQIPCELPELSTSAHFCISWKSTIPYMQPLQWRHVKVSEVFTIIFKIILCFQAVHIECCTNSNHSPACLTDREVFRR